jgi:hypothetical protein
MYSLYIMYTIHYVLGIHYVYLIVIWLILYVLSLVQGLGIWPHDIQPSMDHIERKPCYYLDTLASPLYGRTDHACQCISIYLGFNTYENQKKLHKV